MISIKKNLLISDPKTGKEVKFSPNIEQDVVKLKRAVEQKFYYPLLAMKQLKALATGPIGKTNVFIPNINDSRAHTFQMYHVILPGMKATVERRSDDTLTVTKLELSEGYQAVSENEYKPGIYEVSNSGGSMVTKYKTNDRIKASDGRSVIVADTKYRSPQEAAKRSLNRVEKIVGENVFMNVDFDLMYSPAGYSLGGWRNYDPRSITDGYAFANLLANAMKAAQTKKNILWVSENGGSVVLTQSMAVLAQQNIKFENHAISMHKPTSDPREAVRLATRLELNMPKKLVKSGGLRSSVSLLIANAKRAQNRKDEYSWYDYGADIAKGSMEGVGIGGVALFGAGLAYPAVPAIATASTVVGGIGAAQLLWTKCKNIWKK